jgi:hypothetical protein
MKKTLLTIVLTTVVVLTLIGVISALFAPRAGTTFNKVTSSLNGGYGGGASPDIMMEAPGIAPAPAEMYASDASREYDLTYPESVVTSNLAEAERLIIQNVDMGIVVADPQTQMQAIADMATGMGGFVVSYNTYQTTYGVNNIEVPEGSMTIRVPADQLDEALAFIKKDAVEVTYENRSGEDVTSQYVDLESRLAAKRAAEKKLLEILNDAETTEDTLAVYTQLQQIQTEIEVLVGQMKYYEESAALSAISIRLVAEETVQPIEIGGWELKGTANDAVTDLIEFTKGFTQFLIRFVLYILPALILIAIPISLAFIGVRALFRRFRKPKAVVEVKEEEKK